MAGGDWRRKARKLIRVFHQVTYCDGKSGSNPSWGICYRGRDSKIVYMKAMRAKDFMYQILFSV